MTIRKAAIIAASMLMLIVFVRINGDVSFYLAAVKSGGASLAIGKIERSDEEKRQLYDTIVSEAANKREAPVNAVIDRVWRAIPGYNGIEVDVERTYEAALRTPASSAIPYIFKEIEPTIKLEDLGTHPVFRGNPHKKMIALMINVAWGNEFIDPMLKTLEQERVKATFFLDGSWLNKNAELARKIQAAGHEMSNHAYSHPNMSELSREAAYTQIAKTEKLLKSTLGVSNRWFAPPSGDFNQMTVQVAREQGLQTVLWTIDTVDWRKPPAESIIRKINAKLEPGALILMHPTASSRDALAGMIASAKAKGYALGTVSETLSSERIVPSVIEGADLF